MNVLRKPEVRHALVLLLLLGAGLLFVGCGGGSGTPPPNGGGGAGTCAAGNGTPITISGTVRYERLTLGVGGLGPPILTPPARHVDVEVRSVPSGACYGRDHADASGAYSIVVVPDAGSTLQVVALSRTLDDPAHDVTVHEGLPPVFNVHAETDVFSHASGAFGSASDRVVDLTVPYAGGPSNRPSIGFSVLDTMITCWDAATAALGAPLPPLHVYTQLGNNFVLGSASYYSHSARAIAVLAGAAGNPDNSDTDYFDDAILAHEFSHYLDRNFSHSMSRGGSHGGEPLEPNFAWSEGAATGFGCLLLRDPWYIDTNSTSGSLIFAASSEDVTIFDPAGIGGEFTVAEIVWDLGDGGSGPADADGDPGAVALSGLYEALTGFSPATDAPYVGLFADRVVKLVPSPISASAMNELLSGGPGREDQDIRYPITRPQDVWPRQIGIGGSDTGTLDSLRALPPGTKNMCRGIETTAWYHLVLAVPAVVNIGLTITPIAGSGDDLNLILTSNADVNTPLAFSANAGAAAESINISLAAGTYVIRVEAASDCVTTGNRASYELTVN